MRQHIDCAAMDSENDTKAPDEADAPLEKPCAKAEALCVPVPVSAEAGRLATYATLGALTGALPLPWIPDLLAKRVRGTLVYDLAARHGFSLTPEARDVLADPSDGTTGAVKAARFVGFKLLSRIGPLALVPPIQGAVVVLVLGHLFDRYLQGRQEASVRIDVTEARRVRAAIDGALVEALSVDVKLGERGIAPEELRDSTTQLVDRVLSGAASLPGWLMRRLEVAFEKLMTSAP